MGRLSKKSPHIAARIARHEGRTWPAHYLGYFDCFNNGQYYEAHDVLEERWLAEGRAGSNYAFYKGLIQLAGAFVHLQKKRLKPAVALFQLAETNLRQYPTAHDGLDLARVLDLVTQWKGWILASDFTVNPLESQAPPRLETPAEP